MTEREQLEKAIEVQESLRGTLDDAVIEATIAALRKQLDSLNKVGQSEQRKLVTVLFVDIVDSTNMVHNLDPEDSLRIMDTALTRLSTPVEQHGGRVTRYMGDGFKAVFGLPIAHENDADMAVLTGLDIIDSAQAYARELQQQHDIPDFQVRVGINTGWVASGGHSEAGDTIMGTTVNLAARLEAAADPSTILISQQTYQHVRGVFDLAPREPIEAKGFPEPVPVYRVLQAKARSFRTRRRGVEGVEIRMVGRDDEMQRLQDSFRTVIDRSIQQMVTIVGEAGLGKSRLLYEFENWVDLEPEDILFFRGRARFETRGLPYALLRDLFAFRFEIQDDEPAHLVREKLESGFKIGFGVNSDSDIAEKSAHVVGQLFGYDFRSSPHLAGLIENPQKLRKQAVEYLVDYFQAICAQDPAMILLEDLHWADDSSLDMFNEISIALPNEPLLMVAATRPALLARSPDWSNETSRQFRLELQPLSERDSQTLVAEVLQKAENIPPRLLELIVSNAEGNPYYVEELVKMLIQDEVIIKGEERWRVRPERLEETHVPATLTGVLQARLDRLPESERTLIQRASVVGRVFWEDTIYHLYDGDSSDTRAINIRRHLLSLGNREMVYKRDSSAFVGTEEYIFKHAILRRVTYESVLLRERQKYHARIAQWLIDHSGERAEEVTGVIAYHLEQAGQIKDALAYLKKAGEDAARLYAVDEAIRFYDQALELVRNHPDVFDQRERASLCKKRGEVHALVGNFAGAVTDMAFVLEAAKQAGETAEEREILTEIGMVYRRADDYDNALNYLSQAVEVARLSGNQRAVADTLYHLGSVIWSQGENSKAINYHEEAYDICQKLNLKDIVAVQAFHGRAEAYWINGRPDLAIPLFQVSLGMAELIREKSYESENIQMIAYLNCGFMGIGDYQTSQKLIERAIAINEAAHLDWHTLAATLTLAEANRGLGNYSKAIEIAHKAVEISSSIGNKRFLSMSFNQMAMILLDLKLEEYAEKYFLQAIKQAEDAKTFWWVPALRAGIATARLRLGNLAVESMLQEALGNSRTRRQIMHSFPCLEGLMELAYAQDQYEVALGYADTLLTLAETGGMQEWRFQALRGRCLAFSAMGKQEEAKQALELAAGLAQTINSPHLSWNLERAWMQLNLDLGNAAAAKRHEAQATAIMESMWSGINKRSIEADLSQI